MGLAFDLHAEARHFSGTLSSLLNSTVSNGANIAVLALNRQPVVQIAHGITRRNQVARAFPLHRKAHQPLVFMNLSFQLAPDHSGKHLMVTSSVCSLSLDKDGSQPLLHYDYERDKPDDYPEAHVQVAAHSEYWEKILPHKRKLSHLHLPVGGRRNRPTVEDVIEFVAREGLVETRAGWKRHVDISREDFLRIQLHAATRRNPQAAARTLKDLGWSCIPPQQQDPKETCF